MTPIMKIKLLSMPPSITSNQIITQIMEAADWENWEKFPRNQTKYKNFRNLRGKIRESVQNSKKSRIETILIQTKNNRNFKNPKRSVNKIRLLLIKLMNMSRDLRKNLRMRTMIRISLIRMMISLFNLFKDNPKIGKLMITMVKMKVNIMTVK